MRKGFLLTLFIFLLSIAHAKFLEFVVRVKDYDSGNLLNNAYGTVYLNGLKKSTVQISNGELFFKLEYDQEYSIDIEDPTHDRLTFKVNTFMPAEVKKYVYRFTSNINLIAKKEGFKIVYAQDPTIKVEFDKQKDNYTMKQKYSPSYNFVPDKPVAVNPVIPPKPVPVEIPKKDTAKMVAAPVKRPADKSVAFDQRAIDAKEDKARIDREIEQEKQKELKDRVLMSSKRRSFMEEIADSQRGFKMVSYEHTEKRLP